LDEIDEWAIGGGIEGDMKVDVRWSLSMTDVSLR
jgi:hypothetical protein